MVKYQKITPEQKKELYNQFYIIFRRMSFMIQYHNRRMNFFKKWNLSLKFVDAVVGVGGLVAIVLYKETNVSLWVAGIAVLLLFLNVLFDFSKKEETHRWLLSSYTDFEKIDIDTELVNWKGLSEENYEKYKNILFDISEKINKLKKEEFPRLEFLRFLCGIYNQQVEEENIPIIFHVKWWHFSFANYFSMPNVEAKLIEKFNAKIQQEQEQKKKQKQKQQKPSKDKKA